MGSCRVAWIVLGCGGPYVLVLESCWLQSEACLFVSCFTRHDYDAALTCY